MQPFHVEVVSWKREWWACFQLGLTWLFVRSKRGGVWLFTCQVGNCSVGLLTVTSKTRSGIIKFKLAQFMDLTGGVWCGCSSQECVKDMILASCYTMSYHKSPHPVDMLILLHVIQANCTYEVTQRSLNAPPHGKLSRTVNPPSYPSCQVIQV